MTRSKAQRAWWTSASLACGRGLRWRVGTLDLSVLRLTGEWQIGFTAGSPDEDPDDFEVTEISELPEDAETLERYAARASLNDIRCLPALADRAVVVRPRMPVLVPPDEEIRIFVSSPCWLQIEIGPPWELLREGPIQRLSDTWFGPSTLRGELAYSLGTHARVHLEEIEILPHRVITPVLLRNRGVDTLFVDRLNLPVPYLSLYETEKRGLWTESVTMDRTEGLEMASLRIDPGPPQEAGKAKQLNEARRPGERNVIVRAFTGLLGAFSLGGEH